MNVKRGTWVALPLLLTVLLLVGMLLSVRAGNISAAPVAAPTPVAVNVYPSSVSDWSFVTFWDGSTALTADGLGSCVESAGYSIADVQYSIDQGTTNTTTVKLRFTNDKVTYSDGVNVVAANAADASDLQPFGLYGRYVCLYADVANSNAITITANAVLK
jgi:hypothetical protein